MDKGNKTAVAGIMIGVAAAIASVAANFLFPTIAPIIWRWLFLSGLFAILISILYLLDLHSLSAKTKIVRWSIPIVVLIAFFLSVAAIENSKHATVDLSRTAASVPLTAALRDTPTPNDVKAPVFSLTDDQLTSVLDQISASTGPTQNSPTSDAGCSKSGASMQFTNITAEDGQGNGMVIYGSPSLCVNNYTAKNITGNAVEVLPAKPPPPPAGFIATPTP